MPTTTQSASANDLRAFAATGGSRMCIGMSSKKSSPAPLILHGPVHLGSEEAGLRSARGKAGKEVTIAGISD
jgi:hypothetical protein